MQSEEEDPQHYYVTPTLKRNASIGSTGEPEAPPRTIHALTSTSSVFGFEEAELKAAGGEHDDKPDDYLELTADGLGKRKKSQK